MEVKAHENKDRVTIEIDGEIDITNVNKLRKILLNAITNDKKRIILDLSKVTKIDTSGMGVLMVSRNKAIDINGEFYLSNVPEYINKLFNITHIKKNFKYMKN